MPQKFTDEDPLAKRKQVTVLHTLRRSINIQVGHHSRFRFMRTLPSRTAPHKARIAWA